MIKLADGRWASKNGTTFMECMITRKPCVGVHAGIFKGSLMIKGPMGKQPVSIDLPPKFVCRVEAIEAMVAIIGETVLESVGRNRQCEVIPGSPVVVEFKWLYASAAPEEVLSDGRGNPLPKNRSTPPPKGAGSEIKGEILGKDGPGQGQETSGGPPMQGHKTPSPGGEGEAPTGDSPTLGSPDLSSPGHPPLRLL